MGVERSEDSAFGGAGGFGMVNCIDKERETEDVREEDEFLRTIVP